MRKLILLALGGAAAAYVMKNRGDQASGAPATATATPGTGYAPGPESAADTPATDEVTPGPQDTAAEEASVDPVADTTETEAIDPAARFDQTENAPTGEGVVPDTSDDDPLVRQQEDAAAAQAGEIGGDPDTVTADVDPEMRPVVEGSGDAEETFEDTEDQGR